MIDLRVLRDHWTEPGARDVFAELVTQCVQNTYPGAQTVRPFPGDEGVDTFVGRFDEKLRVWQAKYFCDGIGKSQQQNIRESWRACRSSSVFNQIVQWTLCVPTDLAIKEHKWWQQWSRREQEQYGIQIELWAKSHFVAFSAKPALADVFNIALKRGIALASAHEALQGMRNGRQTHPLRELPQPNLFRDAIFVRKLEAAGVTQHRAARTAFYNFELLRAAVEQGGTQGEMEALTDLQLRIHELWEDAFNEFSPDQLGRAFVAIVHERVSREHRGCLDSQLPASSTHKRGGLHYWADLCQAGWTVDHQSIGAVGDDVA